MLNEFNASLECVTGTALTYDDAVVAAKTLLATKGNSNRVVWIDSVLFIDPVAGAEVTVALWYSTGIQIPILTSLKENQNG